ncbi:hypothetical protein HW555_003091 [Spodoptera exigua]|uniref:Uncharacterized protein n=1 Tax=Spodoptera exigua TaxID=7107 RepID=A0A835GPJ7_SPOEX|nr:hypothetical protein HW555_003091 [Spodoptera exigua]
MEGFCRGCLVKYNDPMELLQYTEKYRRLFVYSTGLQVKRNDTFIFQLCKDCFLNMKQACKFKKQCRTSDKQFTNYKALKDVGDPIDFYTFLKNSDDALTFRLPLASGNSTPATQKRDDDNESTCTSIRNFMTDILQGEEMPDTEARIIREVIEEEADVLEDSLDSHWLQDDVSIDTDFRLDFSFSPFSTPRTENNDHCYTPKKYVEQKDEQMNFETVNTEKQTRILNDFTKAFQNDQNIKEHDSFDNKVVGNTESFKSIKEFYSYEANDPIANIGSIKSEKKPHKSSKHIKDLADYGTEDMSTKEVQLKRNFANKHLKELCDFSLDGIEKPDSNKNDSLKELCNMTLDEFEKRKLDNNVKNHEDVKMMCDFGADEIDGLDKSVSNLDLPSLEDSDKGRTSGLNFYTENISSVKSNNEISNSSINIEALLKDKPCTIDRNLEEALKNPDNKEFSLDEILVSPPEPYDNVQGDIEIFEEFFQNATKEFDIDDIRKANVDINGQWKRDSKFINIKVANDNLNDFEMVDIDNEKELIENNKEKSEMVKDDSENNKKSHCDSCNKEFKNIRALNIHMARIHGQVNRKPTNNKNTKLCSQCGLEVKDISNFKRHLNICGQYICSICNAIMNKRNNFILHMRRHEKKYSIRCTECSRGFYRQSDLKTHMRQHTGETPFSCNYCNRLFSRQDVLKRHIKIHLGERKYECDTCGLKFKRKCNVSLHIMKNKCQPKPSENKKEVKNKLVVANTDITVIYATGDNDSIKKQLPFLETELSN